LRVGARWLLISGGKRGQARSLFTTRETHTVRTGWYLVGITLGGATTKAACMITMGGRRGEKGNSQKIEKTKDWWSFGTWW